jgi:Malectin domain
VDLESSPIAVQERAELDAMVERLARSSRLSQLLRYVGEKYFQGESDQIREYDIATGVFGRPLTFDPGQDAIARVEIHRLRKKLKEYYDVEGKDQQIRISIPPGTYAPVFQHRTESAKVIPRQESAIQSLAVTSERTVLAPGLKRLGRLWFYTVTIAGLIAASLIVHRVYLTKGVTQTATNLAHAIDQPQTVSAASYLPSGWTSGSAIRLLAGYSGQPHVDPAGAVWGPDQYFERGGSWLGSPQFTARTNDPFLFQLVRTGDFSYHIPLKPGIYELRLYFVEPYYGPGLGGGELSRSFNVIVNQHLVLPGFDIESDAMGPNIADERIFKDIQPADDGKLHIDFESMSGKPILSAVEIVPGIPHKQSPISLTVQPSVYIGHDGKMWAPDNYFLGGQLSLRRPAVTGTEDPGLYAMERYGHFTYAIPVDVRSRYTVILRFAEFYFGPEAPGRGGVGSRLFNVMCNGAMLLDNFDIFKEAGSLHAVTKTFRHLKPSAQGKLNLLFEPIANYASISAIEVLDESP